MSRKKGDKLVQPVYRMEEQVESAYAAAFFGRSQQEEGGGCWQGPRSSLAHWLPPVITGAISLKRKGQGLWEIPFSRSPADFYISKSSDKNKATGIDLIGFLDR